MKQVKWQQNVITEDTRYFDINICWLNAVSTHSEEYKKETIYW